MSKKKMVVKGLALLVCVFMLAPFTALAQEPYASNVDSNYDDVVDIYEVLTFLEDFAVNQLHTSFVDENQCDGDLDYAGDVNLILTMVFLGSLDLENIDLAPASAACVDYCENSYTRQLNQLWCRFICGRCEGVDVEPCPTPARNPNRPPVTRCKCGEECCVMGEKCCGRDAGLELCCPRSKKCCVGDLGSECCERDESCCEGECCPRGRECSVGGCCAEGEVSCFDVDCCPPERCSGKGCCAEGEVAAGLLCCSPGETFCGPLGKGSQVCCPPDECVNGQCEACLSGQERCGDLCCDPPEVCNKWTDLVGVEHHRCCPVGLEACIAMCCPEGMFCCGKEDARGALCCTEPSCCIPDPIPPNLPTASCSPVCSCPSNQCPDVSED